MGLTGLLIAWCAASADPPPAGRNTATDRPAIVYLDDHRPVLIRLRITLQGKPLQAVWDDLIDQIFKEADRDGDGFLSREEVERLPSASQLFGNGIGPGLAPRQAPGLGRPFLANLDTNNDGKVSRTELADYYRKNGGAPFQLRLGADVNVPFRVGQFAPAPPPAGEAVSEALFNLLDTNHDGKLSRAELAAAPEVLQKIDVNDDEMISVAEVLPNPGPPTGIAVAGQPSRQPPVPKNAAFVLIAPGQSKELARRLLERYAPEGQDSLTRKDVGLDAAVFDRLDANKDGKLDREELARFADLPADLELNAAVGGRQGTVALLGGGTLHEKVTSRSGEVFFEMGRTRLEVRAGELPPPNGQQANQVRTQIVNQFKNADRKGKGYLTQQDAEASPFFRNSFKLMDLNGDGKLEEKEVLAFLKQLEALQAKARASSVTLTVADNGRGFFDLIDTNGDGRLSVRELRNAVRLLDRFDSDGDGQLSRAELPRRYQLTLRPGPASGNGSQAGVVFVVRGEASGPPTPEPKAGPLWFRKMDRNHDGDVSRREFLGTEEEFRKIDTDGDGLISLEEAERYDARLRKEQQPKR
jgi:Ca2+-binding EF-hand superfamily protein